MGTIRACVSTGRSERFHLGPVSGSKWVHLRSRSSLEPVPWKRVERFQVDTDMKRGNKLLSKRDHMTRLAPSLNFDYFRDETKPNLSCDDDEFANTFIFYFSPVFYSNASNVCVHI